MVDTAPCCTVLKLLEHYTIFTYQLHNRTQSFKALQYYIIFNYIASYLVNIAPQFTVLSLVSEETVPFFCFASTYSHKMDEDAIRNILEAASEQVLSFSESDFSIDESGDDDV